MSLELIDMMIYFINGKIISFAWAFREALDLTFLLVITVFALGSDETALQFFELCPMIVWIETFSTQVSICAFPNKCSVWK
jgi:hypothetical protein